MRGMVRTSCISAVATYAVVFGAQAWAQHEPFIVHDTRPVIMNGPYLVAPAERSITVVWTTDTPCHSKVVYSTGDQLTREAEPQVHGLLPVGLLHTVHIAGLEPGRTYDYKVVSVRVVKMKSYWPEKGLPVESPTYSFRTFDRGKPSVSFSLITDTHGDVARISALTKMVDWDSTDFLVHLGDALDVENEEIILSRWLDPLSKALAHKRPLVYARGNHDTRGPGARAILGYVPTEEGRYYYARDHGPIHFIVLDTGEDKDDNTNVYSELNRFKEYREAEFMWLRDHFRADVRIADAPFRVILMHAPNWGWVDNQNARWTELANTAGVDLIIAGHTHKLSHTQAGEGGKNHDVLVIGPDNLARVDATTDKLSVTVRAKDGSTVSSFALSAKRRRE